MTDMIARWHEGVRAFERGEQVPSDPAEAEGWYYAENARAHESASGRKPRPVSDLVIPAAILAAILFFAGAGVVFTAWAAARLLAKGLLAWNG